MPDLEERGTARRQQLSDRVGDQDRPNRHYRHVHDYPDEGCHDGEDRRLQARGPEISDGVS